jgi:hypothetical protein
MLNEIRLGAGLEPRLLHDCDECEFVGYLRVNHVDHDVWVHNRGSADDAHVIARFGNDGADYRSLDLDIAKTLSSGGVLRFAAEMVMFRANVINDETVGA